MTKRWLTALLILWILGSALPEAAFAENLDAVTLQLRWQHQFQFAGYYVALWNGYYEEEGLSVDIKSAFTPSGLVQATDEVTAGRADFGVGASDILIAEDKGANLKLIASFFQKSPVEYYALAKTPINSPLDFPNLKVARRSNDLLDIEYQVILEQEGMKPLAGDFVTMERDFTIEDLTSGRFDMVPGYLGKIPYFAAKQKVELQRINAYQYGIDFYGDSLFTSAKLAAQNPLLVERFRRASIKGWLYALEHPEEVAKKIATTYPSFEDNPTDELNFNLQQANEVKALMLYPHVEIGNINPYRWDKMASTLNTLGITQVKVPVPQMIFNYEHIQYQRFESTVRNIGILLLSILFTSILYFLFNLNRKNKNLKQEVQYRKTLEGHLKLSNARYETIFNSSVLGITLTTSEGQIISHNHTWCKMLDYEPDEMLTKNIRELIYSEDLLQDYEQMQALRADEIASYVTVKRYVKKTGEIIWGKLFMTRIFDLDLVTPLNMGMVVDVTRDVAESEALRKSEALILYQARMAAMGEMIANIAHQWRQPLNALNLVFANLKDAFETKELNQVEMDRGQAKAAKLIQRMSETIDDFRYFANPQTTPHCFKLQDIVDIAVDLLEAQLTQYQIELTASIPESITLYGNDNHLTQALFNLIGNAIDAVKLLPAVHRRIEIKAWLEMDLVLIEVIDWGLGVPEAIRDSIFDMYFTTKEANGGTGLGLHMTKTIIESIFKGQISLCVSDKASGACFQLQIPHVQTPMEEKNCHDGL